jgi:excinuclease ABC subunit C
MQGGRSSRVQPKATGMTLGEDMARARARLAEVPQQPGVYLFRDLAGKVVYVGKAVRLQDRLRAYLGGGGGAKERRIMDSAADFEFLLAGSEIEALTTEASLISHYRPRFNIRLRDERDFLYFKIPPGEFPRLEVVRRREGPGHYFGPYSTWAEVKRMLWVIKRNLPYRACTDEEMRSGKPCHDYLIGRCAGVCAGVMDAAAYRQRLDEISMFLEGRSQALKKHLRAAMEMAAENLEFERAARLRDQVAVIEAVRLTYKAVGREDEDEDLIGLAREGVRACAMLERVRGGRVVSQESHVLEVGPEVDDGEIMRGFLLDYYARASALPKRIGTSVAALEEALLADWLGKLAGHKIGLGAPRRGRRRNLCVRLQRSAKERLLQLEIRDGEKQRRAQESLLDLQRQLQLPALPTRIECYDISHIQGTAVVGSMVVFLDGVAAKAHYRSFGIRGEWADDTARQAEMMRRRLQRLGSGSEKDASFGSRPDLVIIDGGLGQLHAVRAVEQEEGFADLVTVALAKEHEEIFQPGKPWGLRLPARSPALFLVQRVRDEAHRFAISKHRSLRGKGALASPLDSVTGLGPVRKKRLLRKFGSLEGIRQAAEEEWGLPKSVALSLKAVLQGAGAGL